MNPNFLIFCNTQSGGIQLGNNLFCQLSESGLTGARNFTFPDAAVQLTGLTDTATLSNKTMLADVNTFSGLRQDPTVKRTGIAQAASLSAAASATNIVNLDGILTAYTATGAGTNSQAWDTTEGLIMTWSSSTTASAQIGLVPPTLSCSAAYRVDSF